MKTFFNIDGKTFAKLFLFVFLGFLSLLLWFMLMGDLLAGIQEKSSLTVLMSVLGVILNAGIELFILGYVVDRIVKIRKEIKDLK